MQPLALLIVLVGLPGALYPYRMARFGEQIDAIGSERSMRSVEPADWNVTLTRLVSVGIVIYGLVWFVFG